MNPADRRLLRLPSVAGWVVLAVLLVLAARARLSVDPVAISEWDSWGWLKPALGWVGGVGFHEEYEREWLYGAFIALCLQVTGSFAGYVLVQQGLGLAAAVLLWLAWRIWVSLWPPRLVVEIVTSAVGVTVIGYILFNPITRALELSIRPEAIMLFVASAQLVCVLAYCRFRWISPRPLAASLAGALAILLAVAMYILKPNWLLAVPATVAPVAAGVFGSGWPRVWRLAAPVGGMILMVVLLWLPDKLLFRRTTHTRVVLPMTLFTIHADIIRASMADERDGAVPPDRRDFLSAFLPLLDEELARSRREKIFYTRLGFDPDYLMYRATLFPRLGTDFGMSQPELAAFCKREFLRALARKPLDYSGKVGRQFAYFLFPDSGTFYRKRIELGPVYAYAISTLPTQPDGRWNARTAAMFTAYRDGASARIGSADRLEAKKSTRLRLERIRAAAPWVMGGFFLALAVSLFWRPLAPLRAAGLTALLLFAAPAGNALTVAMVHALDNARYRGSYGPLLLFALAAMGIFAASVLAWTLVLAYRKTRRA